MCTEGILGKKITLQGSTVSARNQGMCERADEVNNNNFHLAYQKAFAHKACKQPQHTNEC